MKVSYISTVAAVIFVTAAKPHHYGHHHGVAKRAAQADVVIHAPVTVETVTKYILDGHEISAAEVHQGLTNGTLEWGSDGVLSSSVKISVPLATPALVPSPKSHPTEEKPKAIQGPTKPAAMPVEMSSSSVASKPSATKKPDSHLDDSLTTTAQLVDKDGKCASCNKEFPNNEIPCTKFPYGYGAMPINQEGLGGWSGIQDPGYRGADGYDDIRTVVAGSCKDGSCCTPGSFCSYGCPNPYLKLSFPRQQGRTGQSVGGLYCNKNGMLEMADGSIGKTLCGEGSKHMTVKVHNRLSKPVSICRTDYPGTESMTFPLTVGPGETGYLANPDQTRYFFWKSGATSAHYYVNKQGVSEAEGCTWSNPNEAKGNWAPTIFGTSWDDRNMNIGFSSLKQNELRRDAQLDYSITFTGDGVNAPCGYKRSTDQYCQGDNCWCVKDEPDRGCTASTKPGGTLTLVLHDD
ncbi:hypothetical protein GQ44DRAFT_802065 [Phaeosphaeriaceae sp. PMI808]|nr:hypothetical protein GQ44DRAFT_802065 [Phaeosphaeriaceae sp. PMI808]